MSKIIVIGNDLNAAIAALSLKQSGKNVEIYNPFREFLSDLIWFTDVSRISSTVLRSLEIPQSQLNWSEHAQETWVSTHGQNPFRLSDSVSYQKLIKKIGNWKPFVKALTDSPPLTLNAIEGENIFQALQTAIKVRSLGSHDMTELLRTLPMCAADWLNFEMEDKLAASACAQMGVHHQFAGPWSPFTALTTLLELSMDRVRITGGSKKLRSALLANLEARSIPINNEVQINSIEVKEGKLTSLHTRGSDGDSELTPDAILICVDPKKVLRENWIHPIHWPRSVRFKLNNARGRGVCATAQIKTTSPHHLPGDRVVLTEDFNRTERAFDEVKYGRMSESPVLEIYPDPDSELEFQIIAHFIPFDLKENWTTQTRSQLEERIRNSLERHFRGLSENISSMKLQTPADLADTLGVAEGNPLAIEPAADQLIPLRPSPEWARYRTHIEGVFNGGNGSHPGWALHTGWPGFLAASEIKSNPRKLPQNSARVE